MAGTLFVVATPIGHLGDITLRAIDTLRQSARIVAEDTRRTRALLTHLGISGKPIERLDAHAKPADIARILGRLAQGEPIALVTDAGTPLVSDPGAALVQAAAGAGFVVVPIPGASAVMAAVSASGLVSGGFRFLGFVPRRGPERRETIETIRQTPEPVVLFEAPQRTAELLEDLAKAMPSRHAAVARELTKVHEEILRGNLQELAKSTQGREWAGEVTLVLGEGLESAGETRMSDEEIDRRIDEEIGQGRRARDIAEGIALESGRPRREIYDRVVARRG
jgi:16S rRNA (cytidine1402-2'-O)-methyltransferase